MIQLIWQYRCNKESIPGQATHSLQHNVCSVKLAVTVYKNQSNQYTDTNMRHHYNKLSSKQQHITQPFKALGLGGGKKRLTGSHIGDLDQHTISSKTYVREVKKQSLQIVAFLEAPDYPAKFGPQFHSQSAQGPQKLNVGIVITINIHGHPALIQTIEYKFNKPFHKLTVTNWPLYLLLHPRSDHYMTHFLTSLQLFPQLREPWRRNQVISTCRPQQARFSNCNVEISESNLWEFGTNSNTYKL